MLQILKVLLVMVMVEGLNFNFPGSRNREKKNYKVVKQFFENIEHKIGEDKYVVGYHLRHFCDATFIRAKYYKGQACKGLNQLFGDEYGSEINENKLFDFELLTEPGNEHFRYYDERMLDDERRKKKEPYESRVARFKLETAFFEKINKEWPEKVLKEVDNILDSMESYIKDSVSFLFGALVKNITDKDAKKR